MENKKSRTIVTTTITTEPSSAEDGSNVDALQDKVDDLTQQILVLQAKTDLTQQILVLQAKTDQLAQIVARGQDDREPQACNSQCSHPPTHGRGGVYLGLVRAGDVVQLSERMLKELDDGLRAIAGRLIPRTGGADWSKDGVGMVPLLEKVSLRHDAIPVASEDYWIRYREPRLGRYQRAASMRYAYMNRMPESRANAFYYETFLQLVLFRGIDLEEVP